MSCVVCDTILLHYDYRCKIEQRFRYILAKQRKAKHSAMNTIRIIGGQWRGRKLNFPDGEGLRPTGDRIRETIFNWLSPYIAGSHCLDAFAGSGALGIEAASRGAEQVTFLELFKPAYQQLIANQQLINATNCTIHLTDSLNWLTSHTGSYDIIFLDPPFGKDLVEKSLAIIVENNLLKDKGLVYVEMDSKEQLPSLQGFTIMKEKIAGNVCYRLLSYDR